MISHCKRACSLLATRLCSNISHIHTASYQRLPNIPYDKMIATHRYSPLKMGGITPLHSLQVHYIHKLHLRNEFSTGLNGLQVHQVDRENDKQTSTYTQFLANSLLPVTHAFSTPGVAWLYVPSPQLLREQPKNCPNEHTKHPEDSFEAIAHQS